jgi:hypothetical protein
MSLPEISGGADTMNAIGQTVRESYQLGRAAGADDLCAEGQTAYGKNGNRSLKIGGSVSTFVVRGSHVEPAVVIKVSRIRAGKPSSV